MFKGTSDLAENKLLLLYIFNSVNMPMSNSHITHIVLENNLINYFGLQQYISELVESGFLKDTMDNKKHMLSITERGRDSLDFFITRIPEKKKEIIDKYFETHIEYIKKDIGVVAEYDIEGHNHVVRLALKNNDTSLIELKLPVDSNAQAQEISHIWKNNYNDIYDKIIKLFIK